MHAIVVSHAAIKAANRVHHRLLARLGCEVTLVVPDRWKSGLGLVRVEPEPADSPLDVRVFPRRGLSHSNMYWLAGSLAALVRPGQPTAFYVDEDPAGFMAAQTAQAAAACGAGLVLLAVQNIYKRYPPPFGALQQYVFRRAASSVAISDQAAHTLRVRGYTGPSIPMGHGTDVQPLSTAERDAVRARFGLHSPLAGYVGRLVSEKGVDVFLEALVREPALRGVVAGSGPERERLTQFAIDRGLGDRLVFTGVLSPDDALAVIGALDVLVLPSRTRRNWSEQFGRVLIEAMASDVAVVAADSGAIAEVVHDAGILVPEDDPAALADGIVRALEPDRNRELRLRGMERVRARYTNAAVARALHEALGQAAYGGTLQLATPA